MPRDDLGNQQVQRLARLQSLEERYGPIIHDSVRIDEPPLPTTEALKLLEEVMNSTQLEHGSKPVTITVEFPACADTAFQVLEHMRILRKWKAGKLTTEEVVEQLKQIGVLF